MFCGYDKPVCYFLRKHMTVLWLVYSCPGQEQLSVCWLLSVVGTPGGWWWWALLQCQHRLLHRNTRTDWPPTYLATPGPTIRHGQLPASFFPGPHMCQQGLIGWACRAASSHLLGWPQCPRPWPGVHALSIMTRCYPLQCWAAGHCILLKVRTHSGVWVLATAVTMCQCLLLSIITRIIEPRCRSHENAIKSNNHFQLLHWHHNNDSNCCRPSSSSAA